MSRNVPWLLALSVLIGAIAPLSSGAPAPGNSAKPPPRVESRAQCEALGGTWRRVGLAGIEACDVPTQDAGKACRDSRDCESLCVAPAGADTTKPVQGQCFRSYLVVGSCLSEVKDGRVVQALCVD